MLSETKKRRRKQGTNQASGPSEKRPLIAFTPAFKYGVLWMSAAFFLPMLLWTLFTLATLSGRIPVMRPNPGWAIAWLLLALPCLLTAAKYFRWQGANKWGWIASALFGYAVLSVPAALLIHFQIAEWLGVKLSGRLKTEILSGKRMSAKPKQANRHGRNVIGERLPACCGREVWPLSPFICYGVCFSGCFSCRLPY